MIELKDFENLLQIQSLEMMILKHRGSIEEEQTRITKIEKAIDKSIADKEECQEKLTTLSQEVQKHEGELHKVDTNLARTEENATVVTSSQQAEAIENELTHLRSKKDQLEELILDLIGQSEELEQEISDHAEFHKGSKDSLKEITSEVDTYVKKEESEIEILEGRIQNLFEISSDESTAAYKNSSKLFKGKYPLAHIIDCKCNRCYSVVPRHLESEINRGITVEHCPGCGRLLAPNI